MVIKAQKTMKWLKIIIVAVLLLAVFALTGCGDESATVVEEGAAEVEISAAEVQVPEAAAAVDEADAEEVAMEETAVIEEPIDECLACHIDKEMLIATADPEEEVINENEGEG